MDQQDINNFSSWLQELLRLMQDTHTQLVDMRNENKQLMDEIKAVSGRVDQKDTDIMRLVDTIRGQIDVMRGEISNVKGAVDSTNNHIDSKLNDVKSVINDIKRSV